MLQDKKNRLIYLSSLTLLLSTLEYLIPKPFPFFKLGLANIPLIITLPSFSPVEYLLLAVLKTFSQAIIGGTLFSPFLIISFFGTLSSALTMKISYSYFKKLSFVGISLLGALASNSVQIIVSALLIYGKSIFVAFPLLLGFGIAASVALGYISNIFYEQSEFITRVENNSLPNINSMISSKETKIIKKKRDLFFLLFAVSAIILSIFIENIIYLIALLVLSYLVQKLSKRKLKFTYPLVLLFSMIVLSIFEPNGKVIFKYFTQNSLIFSLIKAIRILIIIASSQILIACNKINFSPFKEIFALSGIFLERFSKTKGSIIKRIDATLLEEN